MLKWIASFILLISAHNYLEAQYCIEGRFTEAQYFSDDDITIINNIQYGFADHWFFGFPEPTLNTFNIAFPEIGTDPVAKRPLVVLAHGGGFWGGEKEEMDSLVRQLAKKGFVAVTANYRNGWDVNGDPENCLGDGTSMHIAIYKAMQDVQACMRFLVSNADTYGIDTSWIFAGGSSAGVYAMMNSIYCSQEEWNLIFPEHEDSFGGIQNATNDIEIDISIKGILNISGGIIDTSFMTPEISLPTISFYGTEDGVIPPNSGSFQGCENYAYVYGSAAINDRLDHNGICNALHERIGYGHETYEDGYLIDNISCFIKSIFCNNCSTYEVNYELGSCSEIQETEVTLPLKKEVNIYPNPGNEYVIIQLENDQNQHSDLHVFDVLGNEVTLISEDGDAAIILHTELLCDGMYFFTFHNSTTMVSGSFIIAD